MQIKIDISVLRETKWADYAIRFLFGGIVTAAAGLIAKKFGASVGGLFLAFPAIFPASATLIEKNAKEEKRKAGLNGTRRRRMEAAVDASGASIGTLGLMVFAVLIWRLMPGYCVGPVLLSATVVWLGVSVMSWKVRKTRKRLLVLRRQNLAIFDGTERLPRIADNAMGIFPKSHLVQRMRALQGFRIAALFCADKLSSQIATPTNLSCLHGT